MKATKILLIILSLILVFSIVGFGNEAIEKVEAYLVSDLDFEVDGEEWSPKDVDGSPLTPLNYNGRTYVPVRSLLEDKGVTVGYESDTRTVLLDYSTMKPIDKASPLLMTVPVDGDVDGDGIDDLTIEKNPNFDIGNINFKQEITLELSEDTTIYTKNSDIEETMEISLTELASSGESITIEKANFKIDQETGLVTSMELFQSEEKASLADGVHIKITIQTDPPKIIIEITW